MWRDSTRKDIAAAALRITAKDNFEMGFCDEVIPEPPGRAPRLRHRCNGVGGGVGPHLGQLEKMSTQKRCWTPGIRNFARWRGITRPCSLPAVGPHWLPYNIEGSTPLL